MYMKIKQYCEEEHDKSNGFCFSNLNFHASRFCDHISYPSSYLELYYRSVIHSVTSILQDYVNLITSYEIQIHEQESSSFSFAFLKSQIIQVFLISHFY